MEKIQKIQIGNINESGIELIGGQITTRIEVLSQSFLETKEIKVLAPGAFNNGKVDLNQLSVMQVRGDYDTGKNREGVLQKFTQAGDVIVKLSSPYDAVYISDEEQEGILVSSFCVIARTKGDVYIPRFLAAYFNSEEYRATVLKKTLGANVQLLSLKRIGELLIPKYSIQKQEEIADYFETIMEKKSLMKKIIDLEMEKLSYMMGGKENV